MTLGKMNTACIITDCDNVALLYYLPNILGHEDQVRSMIYGGKVINETYQRKLFDSTSLISQKLHASIVPNDKKPVWRINELYFTSVKRTRVSPGCVNFSPGWLAQGHHVGRQGLKYVI